MAIASAARCIIARSSGAVDFAGQDDRKCSQAWLNPAAQSRMAIWLRPDIAPVNSAGSFAWSAQAFARIMVVFRPPDEGDVAVAQ